LVAWGQEKKEHIVHPVEEKFRGPTTKGKEGQKLELANIPSNCWEKSGRKGANGQPVKGRRSLLRCKERGDDR